MELAIFRIQKSGMLHLMLVSSVGRQIHSLDKVLGDPTTQQRQLTKEKLDHWLQ